MRATLAKALPAYMGKAELIKKRQTVNDIVFEMLDAHKTFAPQYDRLVSSFDNESVKKICDNLFSWCKQNISYRIEPEERQTTKSPAAMLAHGYGDCKHYASFCGGVLDALNRKGKNINWCYRFASYNFLNNTPEHVFVVVKIRGREYWIDPTPGADKAKPVWQLDKKIKAMPLFRISGMGYTPKHYPVSDLIESIDSDMKPELFAAVQMLLKYGIMDANARVNDGKLSNLQWKLPTSEYNHLVSARRIVQGAAIGGLFADIWKGVKTVYLAAPRNAFLSLVGINAFAYASKIQRALTAPGAKDKLKKLWESLGGSWTALENTVNKGATKKAILGAGPAAAVPAAWVTTAAAVIAAIMPIVKAILDKLGTPPPQELPPIGYNEPMPTGGGIMDFVKENPLAAIAAGTAIFLAFKKSA